MRTITICYSSGNSKGETRRQSQFQRCFAVSWLLCLKAVQFGDDDLNRWNGSLTNLFARLHAHDVNIVNNVIVLEKRRQKY